MTDSARQKHILIGGGSGFIGSALTRVLRNRGDRVTLISRTPGPGSVDLGGREGSRHSGL